MLDKAGAQESVQAYDRRLWPIRQEVAVEEEIQTAYLKQVAHRSVTLVGEKVAKYSSASSIANQASG